jgi:hypothetical protein
MRPRLSSPIAAAIVLWTLQAGANPSARLVYVRGPGADLCPNEEAVRKAVATRLGYDPFFLSAPTTIFVEASRDGDHFAAVVKLVDDQGVERGTRHLQSHTRDCGDLIGTLALTISLVVDPVSLAITPAPPAVDAASTTAPPTPLATAPVPSSSPATPPPPMVAPPTAPERPQAAGRTGGTAFFAGASVLGSIGSALAPTAGAAVFAGVRGGWASLQVEARADLPASASTPPATRSWALFASAVPCAHWLRAFGCVTFGLESIHATGNAAAPRRAETLVALAGARVGVDLVAMDRFDLAAFAGGFVPLQVPRIEIDGVPVHDFSTVAGEVGVSGLERF